MNAVRRVIFLGLVLSLTLAIAGTAVHAAEFVTSKSSSYSISAGETHIGDVYAFGSMVDISGTQQGDLLAWAENINTSGHITGDLFAAGNIVNIGGRIDDTVRCVGSTVSVTAEIDGDLLVFGNIVNIGSGAVITGDLIAYGNKVTVSGTIGGRVKAGGSHVVLNGEIAGPVEGTMGELVLSGSVDGDVKITCDTFKLDPNARVSGNLDYTSREPVDAAFDEIVGGEVLFNVKEEELEEEQGFSWKSVLFGLGWLVAQFIVGAVLLAIFRRLTPAVEDAANDELLSSLGIGFVVAVVAPVAALILLLPVVTIPLSILTLSTWAIAVFLIAKLPAAMWLGGRLLRLMGLAEPSPYLGLLAGLLVLWPLLNIPYLVGVIIWFATVCLGLGAVILGVRARLYPEPDTAMTAGP